VNADIDNPVAHIGHVTGGLRALLAFAGPMGFDLLGRDLASLQQRNTSNSKSCVWADFWFVA
jgi:hypothetical protein